MPRPLALLLLLLGAASASAQQTDPSVLQALSQGDAFFEKRDYQQAYDTYRKADSLAHHSCAECDLRIFSVFRKVGMFDDALDIAKKAVSAAGPNKPLAAQAHLAHGALLAELASKPNDKKLKQAEQDFRDALALDPTVAVAHHNLGVTLLKQNRDSEGVAELTAYIQSPRANPKSVEEARRYIANPILAREPFAPDFSFVSKEGAPVSNKGLQGKVVLLDFWATWCPPCRESVPVLQTLQKKYADKPFEIVSISSDDDEDAWQSFIFKNHMTWTEFLDSSSQVSERFSIESFPTYILLDKDGIIRFRQSGFGSDTQAELEDRIGKALKKPFTGILAKSVASAPPTSSAAVATAASDSASAPHGASISAPGSSPAVASAPAQPATPSLGASSSIEKSFSGDVFHNKFLGFSYPIPRGWSALDTEKVRQTLASSSPLLAMSPTHRQTDILLYATVAPSSADTAAPPLPAILMTALDAPGAMLTTDYVQHMADSIAQAGLKPLGPPQKFSVGDQDLFRVDFEDARAANHVWISLIQTVVKDHVLSFEITASSPLQLNLLASTVRYSSFPD
ncbi:MAG TPA: redoxin family protein [Candidatus Acidoferrales bacterium]|nr:redoxin family protein [Candidatus Acidoferrales bacterium]